MEVTMTVSRFNKRHYEAIATVMQEAKRRPEKDAQWEVILEHLVDMFARDNGQFKRGRFEAACEPGANVRART
jgi:hypothetical protein